MHVMIFKLVMTSHILAAAMKNGHSARLTQASQNNNTLLQSESERERPILSKYSYLKRSLEHFTETVNAPDLSRFRLVEKFSSCTADSVRRQIIESFCNPLASLKIVCATIAFGMGVDCADVPQVITLGVAEDVETYIQQTGRAGRNGEPALALLKVKGENNVEIIMQEKVFC